MGDLFVIFLLGHAFILGHVFVIFLLGKFFVIVLSPIGQVSLSVLYSHLSLMSSLSIALAVHHPPTLSPHQKRWHNCLENLVPEALASSDDS